MNSRQRFNQIMTYGRADHVPLFEEGIRRDVLTAWKKQGMPQGLPLPELFPMDQRKEIFPELEPYPRLKQWPEERAQLGVLKKHLDATDPWRLPDEWSELVEANNTHEYPLMLRVHRGLYETLGVTGWKRFEEVNLMLMDKPKLVSEILEVQAAFAVQLLERVLSEVSVDAAIFSEPISGISGPLISPRMFEDFVALSYVPILEVLQKHGVQTFIIRTYANARILLPVIVKYGLNCLWACEVDLEAMNYSKIRSEYGRDLRLIGGIDVDVLRQDKDAIRREVELKVPPLLDSGGFIPLADGRVRAVVPYENYRFYRALLAQVTGNERELA